jgi:hypothetical protein
LADILEYDFEIDYLPGARKYIQNAISRRPDYKEPPILPYKIPITIDQVALIISLKLDTKDEWFNRIRIGYTEDPYYEDGLNFLDKGLGTNVSIQEQCRCQVRARFFTLEADGLLAHNQTGDHVYQILKP